MRRITLSDVEAGSVAACLRAYAIIREDHAKASADLLTAHRARADATLAYLLESTITRRMLAGKEAEANAADAAKEADSERQD